MKLICAFIFISLCLVARSGSFDDVLSQFLQTHPDVNQTVALYGETIYALSFFYKNDPNCVAAVKNETNAKKEEYEKLYESGNVTLDALVRDFVEVTLPNAVLNTSVCLVESERRRLRGSLDQQVGKVFDANPQADARRIALLEQLAFFTKVSTNNTCTNIVGAQFDAARVVFALDLDNNRTTALQIVAQLLNVTFPTLVKKSQRCLTGDDNTKFDKVANWYLETNPDVNATWLNLIIKFTNLTSFQPHDEACAAPLRNIADMERQVKVYEFVNGKATIDEIITNVIGSILPAMIEEAKACLINNPYAAVKTRSSFRFSRKIQK